MLRRLRRVIPSLACEQLGACPTGVTKTACVLLREVDSWILRWLQHVQHHQSPTFSSSHFSQVGACIVSAEQVILGIGYNGFPRGCPDSTLPWAKKSATGDPLDTKYP